MSATNTHLLADEFADAESVDSNGHRIRLGDYIESLGNDEAGTVVAVAGEAITFINERNGEGLGLGRFVSDAGYNLILRQNSPDIRHIVGTMRTERPIVADRRRKSAEFEKAEKDRTIVLAVAYALRVERQKKKRRRA